MNNKIEIRSIVPALPGWHIARFIPGNEHLWLDPIIAWDITVSSRNYAPGVRDGERLHTADAEPITCEGRADALANPWLLKKPDGTFFDPYDGTDFSNENGVLEHLVRRDSESRD